VKNSPSLGNHLGKSHEPRLRFADKSVSPSQ